MRYQPKLEFANFHCKFGDTYNLIDYLDEIVIPAFLDHNLRRKYGANTYFFYNTRVAVLADEGNCPTVALVGQLVNNTTFESSQIFDEEAGLIPDDQRLRTSPSSMFVLILNTHTLLYLEETRHAPSLRAFRATAGYCLREYHKRYVRELYDAARNDPTRERLTLLHLWEEIPGPRLEVVPLASTDGLRQLLDRFQRLTEVKIRFIDTNDTYHNAAFLDEVQRRKERMRSDKTVLSFKNSEGLNKDAAYDELAPIPQAGAARFEVIGTDWDGVRLRGDEEELKLRVPLSQLPEGFMQRTGLMYRSLLNHVEAHTLRLGEAGQVVIDKLLRLLERANGKAEDI